MFKKFSRSKFITCFMLFVFLTSSSGLAESTSQKIMRLRRQKKTGQETKYVRSKDLTAVEKTKNKTKPQQEHPVKDIKTQKIQIPAEPAREVFQIDASDPLNLIPAGTLVCVRINNFGDSLAKLDQYLMGVAPLPLSMLATGQIGTLLGNPMMTGVNFNGNVLLFGRMGPGITDQYAVMLLPVTNYEDFIGSNPNASKPDADGIATITPPGSFLGPLAVAKAPGGKYAYITRSETKTMIIQAQNSLKTDNSLASAMESFESKRATAMPLWIYGNLDKAVNLFRPMIIPGLQKMQVQVQQAAAQAGQQPNPDQAEKILSLVQNCLDQLKSLSISINPSPEKLTLSVGLSAKKGTDIAKALKPAPSAKKDFTLAGYLDDDAAVNFVMKNNKPLLTTANMFLADLMPEIQNQFPDYKNHMIQSISGMGDELAGSVTFGKSSPMDFKFIMPLSDSVNPEDFLKQQVEAAKAMYSTSESGENAKASPATTYKSCTIHSIQGCIPSGSSMQTGDSFAFESHYSIIDKMIVSASGDITEIHKLIDKVEGSADSPVPVGDMKTAMDAVDDPGSYEFIGSYNLLRVMAGAGEFMKAAPVPQAQMVSGMFEGINTDTKSCMAFTGKIDNGTADVRFILPREHLMELVTAFMQMQQKVMQQMMQQQGGEGNAPVMQMK